MSFPIYLGSSPLCSHWHPTHVRGSQTLRTPSAGGRSGGMATGRRPQPRSGGWKEACQPFQSIIRAPAGLRGKKIAIKVTVEHLSWRGPSWLRGQQEHRCGAAQP